MRIQGTCIILMNTEETKVLIERLTDARENGKTQHYFSENGGFVFSVAN